MEALKNRLREWLGIQRLEQAVGKPKDTGRGHYRSLFSFFVEDGEVSLYSRHERLREDFEELDKKFDELEKFLQIEFFKTEEEVQVYEGGGTGVRVGEQREKGRVPQGETIRGCEEGERDTKRSPMSEEREICPVCGSEYLCGCWKDI